MSNPYQAPQVALRDASPAPTRTWTLTHQGVAIIVAAVCSLQMSAILLFVFNNMWPIPPGHTTTLLGKLALPALLSLSGILLAFRNTVAFYGFAAYFAASVYPNAWDGRLLSFIFLAYSFYLWKRRWLR